MSPMMKEISIPGLPWSVALKRELGPGLPEEMAKETFIRVWTDGETWQNPDIPLKGLPGPTNQKASGQQLPITSRYRAANTTKYPEVLQ